jgi:hypothetical protein
MNRLTLAISNQVIDKQLHDNMEDPASKTIYSVETLPTSSHGTAHSAPNHEPRVQGTPIKGSEDNTFVLSHAVLGNDLQAHDSSHKAQNCSLVAPTYPMTEKNIKPIKIYADTSKIPPSSLSFAFLTKDEEDYVATLQDNWNNPFVPPILPEAPLGTTLNASLNYHSLQTKQRIPPQHLYALSNYRCVQMLRDWEAELAKANVQSECEVNRNTSIHRCRELREEMLAQRSHFEETVSTKVLLGRAVWQHEAFKQIKKERDRSNGLETQLAKERKDKARVEAALAQILEEQRTDPHVEHLEAFSQHMNEELEENHKMLIELERGNWGFRYHQYDPKNPSKGTFMKMVDYILHRKDVLQKEKELLGKFVNIRTFKHDKGNMITLILEGVAESFLKNSQIFGKQLDEAKETLKCGSTLSSPGLPGLPSPPPAAACVCCGEDMEKQVDELELMKTKTSFAHKIAKTFIKHWLIYRECFPDLRVLDLSEDSEEEEEDDAEKDGNYEKGPYPESKSTIDKEKPPILPEDQDMQWLTAIIENAVMRWTDDILYIRDRLDYEKAKVKTLKKDLASSVKLLQKSEHQKSCFGAENRRLRERVKDLESRIAKYIDFMDKTGIQDGITSVEEALYTSIQSLRSLKDENIRLRFLIDSLNSKVEGLNRALNLGKQGSVPRPNAKSLEKSLAEGRQVSGQMFREHKAWLRSFVKVREGSCVEDAAKEDNANGDERSIDVATGIDSTQSSPRKKSPVADDEHFITERGRVGAIDVELGENVCTAAEVEAIEGLHKLRYSRFSESFDDDGEYGRLAME